MKNRLLIHNNWQTPKDLYDKLDSEFHFDFDPCPLNHDLNKWNGLFVTWGKSNFINPPYNKKAKEAFIKKALEVSQLGNLCVLLLPVSTSTLIFHDIIVPNAKRIQFIRGRVKFIGISKNGFNCGKTHGMHDSMIVVFDGRKIKPISNPPKGLIY